MNARPRYTVAFNGEWLGVPAKRRRIATGTCRTMYLARMTLTSVSTVSPRYSTGYHVANSSISGRLQARKPDVVSASGVFAIRESTAESRSIAHLRGPETV